MSHSDESFWTAVETVQRCAFACDMDGAYRAVRAAEDLARGVDDDLLTKRRALLASLEQSLGLRLAAIPHLDGDIPQMPSLRIAVSGVGRSGTTLIYQQIAKLLLLDGKRVNFRYEPYLWDIRNFEDKGNPFGTAQIHHFGLSTHLSTPLFLAGPHPDHDPFIDHLFGAPWDRDPGMTPEVYLTKVIRGSGRLRSYLARYPDLRIVACLRNPADTINSSLGMFSFFGEEFHADDRPRFRDELDRLGAGTSDLGTPDLRIEWYVRWWQAFTEETLSVIRDYPDNVFAFCHEAYQDAPDETLRALMDFLGLQNLGMFMGLDRPAGPSIRSTSLTRHDLHLLKPQMDYYSRAVLAPRIGPEATLARIDKITARYATGRFSFPVAGCDLGQRASIRLRDLILHQVKTPFLRLAEAPAPPIALDELIERHGPHDTGMLPADPIALKAGKRFGAIITCHNNADTICAAVLSCLNQTLPFDEILVVDDSSTDRSPVLLSELEARYSSVRTLLLDANLGPSAARDLGIRRLTTDFFTQLDGDDLCWPTKNAQEVAAITGDDRSVAFSDIMLVKPDQSFVQSTTAYADCSGGEVFLKLLARTPQIPRDMTLSRELYFRAGGYDLTRHLYEDWEFKLRLAAVSGAWRRAKGTAGTVYNRLTPGLSAVHDGEHARMLSTIFLSALAGSPVSQPDTLLAAFDAALGRFGDRHIAVQTRQCLERQLKHGGDLSVFAAFARRRDVAAMPSTLFADALTALIAHVTPAKVDA